MNKILPSEIASTSPKKMDSLKNFSQNNPLENSEVYSREIPTEIDDNFTKKKIGNDLYISKFRCLNNINNNYSDLEEKKLEIEQKKSENSQKTTNILNIFDVKSSINKKTLDLENKIINNSPTEKIKLDLEKKEEDLKKINKINNQNEAVLKYEDSIIDKNIKTNENLISLSYYEFLKYQIKKNFKFKLQEKEKIIDKAHDQFYSQMDLLKILERLKDIKKIKSIVLEIPEKEIFNSSPHSPQSPQENRRNQEKSFLNFFLNKNNETLKSSSFTNKGLFKSSR